MVSMRWVSSSSVRVLLIKVAWARAAEGRLSTWSFINAINGLMTSVMRGNISAGNW